jgi:hypothetical protein
VALQAPVEEVLREAFRSRHKETFERSLGRTVRRHGGSYADYMKLMSEVREKARREKTDVREAARRLANHL